MVSLTEGLTDVHLEVKEVLIFVITMIMTLTGLIIDLTILIGGAGLLMLALLLPIICLVVAILRFGIRTIRKPLMFLGTFAMALGLILLLL